MYPDYSLITRFIIEQSRLLFSRTLGTILARAFLSILEHSDQDQAALCKIPPRSTVCVSSLVLPWSRHVLANRHALSYCNTSAEIHEQCMITPSRPVPSMLFARIFILKNKHVLSTPVPSIKRAFLVIRNQKRTIVLINHNWFRQRICCHFG